MSNIYVYLVIQSVAIEDIFNAPSYRISDNNCRTTNSMNSQNKNETTSNNWKQNLSLTVYAYEFKISALLFFIRLFFSFSFSRTRESNQSHVKWYQSPEFMCYRKSSTISKRMKENIRKYHSTKNIQSIPIDYDSNQQIQRPNLLLLLFGYSATAFFSFSIYVYNFIFSFFVLFIIYFLLSVILFDWLPWVNVYPVAWNMLFISFVVFFFLFFAFISNRKTSESLLCRRTQHTRRIIKHGLNCKIRSQIPFLWHRKNNSDCIYTMFHTSAAIRLIAFLHLTHFPFHICIFVSFLLNEKIGNGNMWLFLWNPKDRIFMIHDFCLQNFCVIVCFNFGAMLPHIACQTNNI